FFMTSFSPLEAILSSFNWSENSRAGQRGHARGSRNDRRGRAMRKRSMHPRAIAPDSLSNSWRTAGKPQPDRELPATRDERACARLAARSNRSGERPVWNRRALEPRLARGGTEVDIGSDASAGLAAGKHFPPRCASAPATSRPAARPPAESARRHVEPTRCRENRSPWNRPITRGFIFTT
ncbi:hypothetical protein QOU69_26550, partial [Burkholderia pseudomallei]